MKKQKTLHIGSLDQVKGFKNISLDLNTYGAIFKTISFLFQYYKKNELDKNPKQIINEEMKNAKISKSKKVVQL
jgi:hypothetical protein